MSSHHFVKENQEPALILANGASCDDELLFSLLEWSPYVLVLDGALERAIMKGIKIDAVLGDFDSIGEQYEEIQKSQHVELIHRPSQDKTDLEKGLDHLIEIGQFAANVLWATGRRLDHTHNNILTLAKYHKSIQVNLIDDHSKAFIIPSIFRKYYPGGVNISIIPIVDTKSINTIGLKYELNNEDLIVTKRTSSSNCKKGDGIVEIRYEEGLLCVMECVD